MNKQAKQSAAKKSSWKKGGAHRIAYEQRMQDKKTSALVHRTSAPDDQEAEFNQQRTAAWEAVRQIKGAAVVKNKLRDSNYPMDAVIRLMQISAFMLIAADKHRPELNELNSNQAKTLMDAAAALESQGSGQ